MVSISPIFSCFTKHASAFVFSRFLSVRLLLSQYLEIFILPSEKSKDSEEASLAVKLLTGMRTNQLFSDIPAPAKVSGRCLPHNLILQEEL
jgi:hypothetical protein